MKHILVVCTGNICRSPMAAALLAREIVAAGLAGQAEVASAGTYAVVGAGASGGSVLAMAERGLDLSGHRGRQLDARLVQEADLILVMEEAHRRSIFYTWPQALRKTFLLSEMVGEHAEIDDPYGGPQEEYEAAAAIIADYVKRGLPGVLRRLGLGD